MITTTTNFSFIKIQNDVSRTLDLNTLQFTKAGAQYMKSITPGKLKNSISVINNEITTTSEHFKYVDEGTKAHKIYGNPILKFEINGVQIFTTVVNHPGNKAQNITDKTVDSIENEIDRKLVNNIAKVL